MTPFFGPPLPILFSKTVHESFNPTSSSGVLREKFLCKKDQTSKSDAWLVKFPGSSGRHGKQAVVCLASPLASVCYANNKRDRLWRDVWDWEGGSSEQRGKGAGLSCPSVNQTQVMRIYGIQRMLLINLNQYFSFYVSTNDIRLSKCERKGREQGEYRSTQYGQASYIRSWRR